MSSNLIAIITGNSNSGKYCIEELFTKYKDLNFKVRAAFRSAEKAKPFAEKYPNLEIVTDVDAYKPETLNKVFQDATSALIVTPLDYTKGFQDDAQLTANMINSAVEHGVKYIVCVGSFTVNNMERMSGIGKRFKPSEDLLEKLGKEKGLKWTMLRGGCFMENFLSHVDKIKSEGVFRHPAINVALVDTKDIGKSAAACLTSTNIDEHNAKCYEMNGPELLTSQDIANHIAKALGIQVNYVEVPKENIKNVMPAPVAGTFEYLVEAGKDAAPFTDHVRKLTDQNGTFEQFLKDHLYH